MSLLTALIVENIHILAGIYITILKNVLNQTWKAFNTDLNLCEKIRKVVLKKGLFRAFLQINCSKSRLKLCQKP